MTHRIALIAYDIQDDRQRRRALRTLREWRLDGQLSVHECLVTATEAAALWARLNQHLDPAIDRLLCAWVQGQRPILARGTGRVAVTSPGLLMAA